jgi:signal transduction histidine kinase
MTSGIRPTDDIGARVLLADHDADVRTAVHRLLSPDYLVWELTDSAAVLEAAREQRPDLLVSDVALPGMDSLALVRALRADPRTGSIPIILLSSRSDQDIAVAGLEAGADDVLVKPFSDRELLARVRALMTQARLRAQLAAAEERQRFAGELHDSLSQTLVGVDLMITHLLTHWQKRAEPAANTVEQLRTVMRLAHAEMRALLNEIRPETVATRRLSDLIELLSELARMRLPADVVYDKLDMDPRPLPAEVQHVFYRIAQEALTNVTQHANATKLEIVLAIKPAKVKLSIRDNGCGFDQQAPQTGGGVPGMRERATSIGAALRIESAPGQGSRVKVTWKRLA